MKILLMLILPWTIMAKDLPFEKDRIYSYSIKTAGEHSGFSKFFLTDTLFKKAPCHAVRETLYVKNFSMEAESRAVLIIGPLGKPLQYTETSRFKVRGDTSKSGHYETNIKFINDGANVEVLRNGAPHIKTGIPISEKMYHTIEGNHLGQFCITLFYMNDLLTTSLKRKVLHIGSYKLVDLELRMLRYLELKTEKNLVPCKKVEYFLAGRKAGTLWISDKGILIKDEERDGELIIELVE